MSNRSVANGMNAETERQRRRFTGDAGVGEPGGDRRCDLYVTCGFECRTRGVGQGPFRGGRAPGRGAGGPRTLAGGSPDVGRHRPRPRARMCCQPRRVVARGLRATSRSRLPRPLVGIAFEPVQRCSHPTGPVNGSRRHARALSPPGPVLHGLHTATREATQVGPAGRAGPPAAGAPGRSPRL